MDDNLNVPIQIVLQKTQCKHEDWNKNPIYGAENP